MSLGFYIFNTYKGKLLKKKKFKRVLFVIFGVLASGHCRFVRNTKIIITTIIRPSGVVILNDFCGGGVIVGAELPNWNTWRRQVRRNASRHPTNVRRVQ